MWSSQSHLVFPFPVCACKGAGAEKLFGKGHDFAVLLTALQMGLLGLWGVQGGCEHSGWELALCSLKCPGRLEPHSDLAQCPAGLPPPWKPGCV